MKLRTGDKVTVIAGANKGKTGNILKVLEVKVIVEGVNIVKKHIKPKYNGGTGEIKEVESPIHKSNVKLVENKKKEVKKEVKKEAKKEVKKETKASTTKKSK